MPWWRRESLHEKLAREGGLILERDASGRSKPPWDKAGIHGLARPRQWDAMATVNAPDLRGDEFSFVALGGERLIVEAGGDVTRPALVPLVEAIEESLAAPYRAEAVRQTAEVWAVAARSIEVAELPPGTPGETVTISGQGGDRTTLVDGEEWLASLPALEAIAEERGLADYVLQATRLEGDLWEVQASPL